MNLIFFRKYKPLFIALIFFGFSTLILFLFAFHYSNNHLFYALDDPYIHMTMAHNLARNGTWGVEEGVFSSCSSSILFTLILTALNNSESINLKNYISEFSVNLPHDVSMELFI